MEPRSADVSVIQFMSLADGGQDCLSERRNCLHIRTEERLFTLPCAQRSSFPLDRVQGTQHLIIVLRRCTEILAGNSRLGSLLELQEPILELEACLTSSAIQESYGLTRRGLDPSV
eukprot:4446374-Pyramimonas_sp.AAC.1